MNGSSTSLESLGRVLAGAGGSSGEPEVPITRYGRVRENRIASNNPQEEKRVLPKRVNWYGTSEPLEDIQTATLVGNMQTMYTAG